MGIEPEAAVPSQPDCQGACKSLRPLSRFDRGRPLRPLSHSAPITCTIWFGIVFGDIQLIFARMYKVSASDLRHLDIVRCAAPEAHARSFSVFRTPFSSHVILPYCLLKPWHTSVLAFLPRHTSVLSSLSVAYFRSAS